MEKARFAEARNSLMIVVMVDGRPWPPNSAGTEMPTQPPSTNPLGRLRLKPFGVVTLPSALRLQPSEIARRD